MFNAVQYQKYSETYKELFAAFPYIPKHLEPWLGKSLGELSQTFQEPTSLSLSTVAQDALVSMVEPVMGAAVAKHLVQSLATSSRMMATHHLGIDCLPEQVQAPHFLALQKLLQAPETMTIIPVLACAGVPLQSYSYPRGLMLASNPQGHKARYPLFPSALQNRLVLATSRLERYGVLKVSKKWDKSLASPRQWDTMQSILHDIILQDDCLSLANFSQQVMHINAKLFRAIYPENPHNHVLYLNLEELATKLVLADLHDTTSVLSTLFFNKTCRNSILDALVNKRACWSDAAKNGQTLDRTGANGTIFFWGIDAQGRRIPLTLQDNPMRLVYGSLSIDFTAQGIRQALCEGRIYPSLYTSFVTLHLQHNLACYGGVYMVDYLPTMLKVTINALQDHYTSPLTAYQNSFGSGVISVQCPINAPIELPNTSRQHYELAGSIELIAHGGIKQKHLHAIAALNYDDMLPMHLAEWTLLHVPNAKSDAQLLAKLNSICSNCHGIQL